MTTNSKLAKVLEHLVKGEEDLARDLLHNVFIEKARAIHEELMTNDEVAHEEEMEEGVVVTIEQDGPDHMGGSGDEGKDLTNDIKSMDNEIDFEETMSEEDDETDDITVDDEIIDGADDMADVDAEVDADMDMADAGVEDADATVSSVEGKLSDLEQALADLKAEFEALEGGAGDVAADAALDGDVAADDMADVDADADAAIGGEEDAVNDDDADDTWALDEEFDELAESLELEVVTKNMEKTVPAEDVGSAKSGMSDGNNAKSVVPPSQTSRFGAKPVAIGKGPDVNGYKLETAPKSSDINIGNSNKDNRRKKATDGTKKVSKEGSVSGSLLNQNVPTDGKMSPLSKGGQNLKS